MRNGKKLVAMLLVIVMLLGILPAPAFAVEEQPPAYTVNDSAGTQIYSTANKSDFLTAWGYAQSNGGTLILHADAESTEKLVVESKKPITIVMNGHSITRNLSKATDGGEVILVKANTSLDIINTTDEAVKANGKITGGWGSSGGGGIHVQENSILKLKGVTVTGNKTTADSGGGGIRLQGKNTTLEMDAYSSVSGNSAKKGGGISIMGEGSRVIGAQLEENKASVSDNKATESDGGGIYVGAKNCSISGLKIKGNTATASDSLGGGIYMATDQCGCEVTDCTITENKAHHGGGIYVDGNGGSLAYSIITKNAAQGTTGCGGGIYIDDGDTLHLSGKLSVYENTATKMERANLYLDTDSVIVLGTITYYYAYISGEPTGTMVDEKYVHIGWDKEEREDILDANTVVIGSEAGKYNADYLRSDVDGYSIYWSWGTKDGWNDRKIKAGKNITQSVPPVTEYVAVSDRYTITPNGYTQDGITCDLQQGVYSYKATSGGDLDATYFYSDGYFVEDPKVYNDHLATMSLALTMSAFNAAGTDFDTKETYNEGYSNRFRNARQLLADLGFQDENIHVSDTFLKKPTNFSIGVIMGAKEMSLTKSVKGVEKPYILLPIAVRGAGYEMEWISNVTLGKSGEAAGFSNAADQVMENLDLFLSAHPELQEALEEGRVKFWVTGFSRSAATANLTSKRLTDQYGEKNKIYAYCFEPPKGGVDSEVKKEDHTYNGQYLNIHNIVNACDIVPYVGPTEMGFKRYGVDHFVPGKSFTEEGLKVTTKKATIDKGASTIQVTSYADNAILPMEQSDDNTNGKLYTKRRDGMTAQLKLLDDSLIYDDYFRLATMNYIGDQFGTNTMIGELRNGDETYAHEWIPVLFKNLQEWALNFTYDNTKQKNKYNGDYRGFYSTNISFTGKDYVTVEEALQVAVSLVFGLSDDKVSELADAMMYRLLKLDLKGVYRHIIAYWYEKSYSEQQGWVTTIWNQMETNMTSNGEPVPKLSDILSKEEYKELERVFPTLLSFLCQFVNYDWWEEPKPSLDGVDTEQIHVGTLAYNAFGLLMNHYPEVVMAWMRTYDSHYMVEESTGFVSADKTDPLINKKVILVAEEENRPDGSQIKLPEAAAPSIRFEGNKANNSQDAEPVFVESATVTISTSITDGKITNGENGATNGSAIYYRMISSGSAGPWKLYEGPFEVNVAGACKVEAYSVRFKDVSDTTAKQCVIKLAGDHCFYIHNNISNEYEQVKLATARHIASVSASEDRMVRNWELPESWKRVDSLSNLKNAGDYVLSADKRSISFVAPDSDDNIFIHYYDECAYMDLSLIRITPVANQPLADTVDLVDLKMYSSYVNQTPGGQIFSNGRLKATIKWSVPNQVEIPTTAEAGVSYNATVTFTQDPSENHKIYIAFLDEMVAQYGNSAYGIVTTYSDTDEMVTITCSFPPVAAPALKGIRWPESVSKTAGGTVITGAPETVIFEIGSMEVDVPVAWSEKEDGTATGTVSITSAEGGYTVKAKNGAAYSFAADLEHFKGNALDGYTATTVYKNIPLTVEPCTSHSGNWKYDETKHWKVCSNAGCGVVFAEGEHEMSDWTESGSAWQKSCPVCGYTQNIDIYTIIFDHNTGEGAVTEAASTNVEYKLTSLPDGPSRDNYNFLGWFTAKEGGTQITTETVFSENTTVYAHWLAIEAECSHNYEKYLYDSEHHWLVCSECGEEQSGSKTAHTAEGWTLDNGQWTASCVCGFCDTEAAVTVSFNANGGTVDLTANRDGKLTSLPNEPSRENYKFLGWFTASTGGEKITVNTVFTQNTTVFAQWQRVDLPLALPTVDLAPGTYNGAKTVTVSHPMDGVTLTVSCNGAVVSGNQVTLAAGEPGTSTVYSITVKAEKEGYISSEATFGYTIKAPAATHQLTVNCYDINLGKTVTTWTGMPKDFRTTYAEGERVTVPAPVFDNMQFVKWSVDGAELTGSITDTVAAFTMGSSDVALVAMYKPIIRQIDLTIDGLENGAQLPAFPKTAKATINLAYQLDPNSLVLNWIPADSKIESGKSYTAEIAVSDLKLADGTELSMENLSIDSETKLLVNGESADILKLGNAYKGIWSFVAKTAPETNPIITDIEVPGNVYLDRSQMNSFSSKLPSTVNVTVDSVNSDISAVNVEWQLNGEFDSKLPEAQSVVAHGTLVIPEKVELVAGLASSIDTDPSTEGIQIRIVFYTNGAARVEMPVANLSSGIYEVNPFVQLTTNTDGADIYYTLDGSEPTQNSTKYTGGFEVDLGKTLKAIAVKSGMLDSYVASYTYSDAISDDSGGPGGTTVIVPSTSSDPTYPPVVDAGDGGSVTVTPKRPEKGDNVTISPNPNSGYEVDEVIITDKNGNPVTVIDNGDGTYSFKQPGGKVNIEVSFKESDTPATRFVDVLASHYYYDAVLWAAKNGITSGTDATHFSPNTTCTRAQAVTFLWRAAGSPKPKTDAMPFVDVAAGSYYYDAVLWAMEEGITIGTSGTTFSSNAKCSRAQIVTFLWRAQKSRAVDAVNPFTDVAADAYYVDAVLWAVKEAITNGTSATAFSPSSDCTRAQIVTFLYRALADK